MRSRSADAAAASTGAETAFMERIVEPGRVPGPVLTHRPQRAARLRLLRSSWVADRDPPRGCWPAYRTCDRSIDRSPPSADTGRASRRDTVCQYLWLMGVS